MRLSDRQPKTVPNAVPGADHHDASISPKMRSSLLVNQKGQNHQLFSLSAEELGLDGSPTASKSIFRQMPGLSFKTLRVWMQCQ